jgi:hypothetical protein
MLPAFRMTSRGPHSRLNRVVALIALLLAVAWLPMTSHELLESAGMIHQDGPDGDHSPAHEAADGFMRLHDGGIFVKAPTLLSVGWIVAVVELSVTGLVVACRVESYLRRATESPPGLIRTWQFALRLALPSRAPSFAI